MDYLVERRPYVKAHAAELGEVLADQAQVVRSVFEQSGDTLSAAAVFDVLRWDRELGGRLTVRNKLTASDFGAVLMDEFGHRRAAPRFDSGALDPFILSTSQLTAEGINAATFDSVQEALAADDPEAELDNVFGILLGSSLDRYAGSTVTTAANFGMRTAADQAGLRSKVWVQNSRNPRSSHQAVNGETVELGGLFSNNMDGPGDPAGGADENAGCQCSLDFEG